MAKTKQEAIAAAYLELISEEDFNSLTITENGWTDLRNDNNRIRRIFRIAKNLVVDQKANIWRPKSLSGIENNNGWVIIDSEFEWDKYNEFLIFWDSVEKKQIKSFKYSLCEFQNKDYKNRFTHYQAIQKPLPPIY